MKKTLIILGLLLLPSALFAQSALRVSSPIGQVEWRSASAKAFVPLAANQSVQAGDVIRTGPGAQVILTVPDGSYMVVNENSSLILEDFWSGNFKSIMNLMLGQVRFYIQRMGGRPNPYSVKTPTALIAVRGTIFDVMVDDGQASEVYCLDGSVTVENIFRSEREVILSPGTRTLVRPGEYPVPPVRSQAELYGNRVVHMRQKNAPDSNSNSMPSLDALTRDNDRRNRPSDPQGTNSRVNDNTQRAKPTLSFPQ
jgi:hypothetical protein